MKVLHIDTGRDWRGGQRQVLFLHEGLMKAGIDSVIVCNSDGKFTGHTSENIIPMKFKGEADMGFLRELKKIIRAEKPDIVHTHDAHALMPALLAKVFGLKYKLINTRRIDFSINKGYFKRKKYDNKQVDVIVAISDAIRRLLINDGIEPEKLKVINSGVRFPKSLEYQTYKDIREKYDLDGKYVVGTVASISETKDHYTMIDAFAKFHKLANESVLMMVGGGHMKEEIEAYAAKQECADSIIFTGHTDKVYEHIAVFDVFAMSSKTEGLCTSIIDAMFMMKPVASTAAGGIPELVKHRFNGLLTPVQDSDALACSFYEIYENGDNVKKFGQNGFHTSLKFSDSSMVSQYIRLYTGLLGYSANNAS
ncbi:MAG: glycosyltransferase [Deferribacterales bacterium]